MKVIIKISFWGIELKEILSWIEERPGFTVFWCVQFTYQYSACVQCYYLVRVAVYQWVKVALKSPPNTILGCWSLCAGETAPQSERHPPALNGTSRPEPHARKLTPGSLPPEVSSSCIVLLIQRPNRWGHWNSGTERYKKNTAYIFKTQAGCFYGKILPPHWALNSI